MTPDVMAREMILSYMNRECKGKPKRIEQSNVEREMERRGEKDNARSLESS
jgi:hypothetical protein